MDFRSLVLGAALAGLAAAAGGARAGTGDAACAVPESLTHVESPLPRAAAAIGAGGAFRLLVIGSASSLGTGVSEAGKAYPVQLAAELGKRFPALRVALVNAARRGDTAAGMADRFDKDVIPAAPHLVVWQSGTVDAVKGVDADAFAHTLDSGIARLHARQIDVILMDAQYNPAAASLVSHERYRERMQWIARAQDVPLFRRHDIMLYWAQNDVVRLTAEGTAEQRRNADLVHRCIAVLLADMIEAAVKTNP
jgi:lysophospholipase L1-like esterase